jgi:hypothetical protein
MKYRQGFVSNSSSTSFCIIGVDKWEMWWIGENSLVEVLWLADGMSLDEDELSNHLSYGHERGNHFQFYGDYEPEYVGYDANELLETMTIPQAKTWFKEQVLRLYGLDIPESIVGFHVGEAGNG